MDTYKGSCHCGKLRYEVELDLGASPVISCNCSMCSRAGWLLTFAKPEHFRLLSDDGAAVYQFNKHAIDHVSCTTCGIKPYSRGKDAKGNDSFAINVRCLEGVDPKSLKTMDFDGASK